MEALPDTAYKAVDDDSQGENSYHLIPYSLRKHLDILKLTPACKALPQDCQPLHSQGGG